MSEEVVKVYEVYFDTEKNRVTGKQDFMVLEDTSRYYGFGFETQEELEDFISQLRNKANELMGWKFEN